MTTVDSPAALSALENLILVRLAVASGKPPSASGIRVDVAKATGSPLAPDEYANLTARLSAEGLVEPRPRSKGAVRLTDAGRAAALDYLGLTALPPRTNWKAVCEKHLVAKALGAEVDASKLGKADKLGAFLIRRAYGLPAGNTLNEVLEALVCKLVGRPDETTLDGLLRAVLSNELGSDRRLTKEDLGKQLPRKVAGTRTDGLRDLWASVVRKWLNGEPDRPADTPAAVATRAEVDPAPLDLPAFAATVKRLARHAPPEARFGDNKAFVAAVWRASQLEHSFPKMPLAAFKAALLAAAREGLIRLEPADLVQAMDPTLVADSAIPVAGAALHFVLIEEARP